MIRNYRDKTPVIGEGAYIDETAIVIGDGKLGLLVAQVLRLTGCELCLVGRHEAKLSIAACLGIDTCLERICDAMLERSGVVLITSDHGNCEQMIDPSEGSPHTAHTTNPVPIVYVGADVDRLRLRDGTLADLAPTLLALLGLSIPAEMTGKTLLEA